MSYWKSKVVPKFKKLFNKSKKKSASETCKTFDSSKESFDKEVEENRSDLQPKVIEIYRATTVVSKKLLKEPSEPAVTENSDAAQSILGDLATAGFPQAQFLSDAAAKSGPANLPGPIVYLFQKVSTFLVEEPLPEMPQETREIAIEGGPPSKAEDTKEPAPSSESGEGVASATEKAEPGEGKRDLAAAEQGVPVEGKKDEVDPAEAKKEVVEQIESQVDTIKPAVEATSEEPPAKEETKEVTPVKEEKKEQVLRTEKEEEKKEKPAQTPPSAGGK